MPYTHDGMGTMWSDTETETDFLNYGELAQVVAMMLADPRMLPLSVGVSGGWGTGKSSFLKMVKTYLPQSPAEGTGTGAARYVVIHYDAWRYQGYDDARAALMDRIGNRLLDEAEKHKDSKTLVEKGMSLVRRTHKLRALAFAADAALTLSGIPTLGFLSKGMTAAEHLLEGNVGATDVADAREAVQKGKDEVGKLVRPETKPSPPQEIEAFRREFAELLEELGAVLVVFVDNLDRCLPAQVIHTLEALRLFVFMGRTAFCVAADEDMIRGSVRKHFEGVGEKHVTDYMDKLIQVPVRVPRLGVPEITSYLMLLFAEADASVQAERMVALREGVGASLRDAWKGEPLGAVAAATLVSDPPGQQLVASFELAERMAPLLVNSSAIAGNPRIIKRLLNTVRLRARLAAVRKMEVEETTIAKLALFERCMGEVATASLYTDIQADPDGMSPRVKALEAASANEAAFAKAVPTDWAGPEQVLFLREWAALEPALGGKDLRAVSHLSRDTIALVGRRRGLSEAATAALKALSDVKKLPSPTADRTAAAIPPAERADVLAGLMTAMRQHKDWTKRPPEANGAVIVARLDPSLREEFGAFLMGMAGPKPAPWLRVFVEGGGPKPRTR